MLVKMFSHAAASGSSRYCRGYFAWQLGSNNSLYNKYLMAHLLRDCRLAENALLRQRCPEWQNDHG